MKAGWKEGKKERRYVGRKESRNYRRKVGKREGMQEVKNECRIERKIQFNCRKME